MRAQKAEAALTEAEIRFKREQTRADEAAELLHRAEDARREVERALEATEEQLRAVRGEAKRASERCGSLDAALTEANLRLSQAREEARGEERRHAAELEVLRGDLGRAREDAEVLRGDLKIAHAANERVRDHECTSDFPLGP
jgi:chromosome segregation ATPase